MDDSKPMAFGFPCKGNNLVILVLKFKDLNRDVTFLDAEQLKPGICALLCLGVAVNLQHERRMSKPQQILLDILQ